MDPTAPRDDTPRTPQDGTAGPPEAAGERGPSPWSVEPRIVLRTTLLLFVALALGDAYCPPQVPISVLYLMPVLTTVWLHRRRRLLEAAGLATLLTLAGASASSGMEPFLVWASAGVSLFAVWTTVYLGFMWLDVQRRLVRSRETTARTLEHLEEGVVSADQDGRVVLMNAAAERLTGWAAVDARGLALAEVVVVERDMVLVPEGEVSGEAEVLVTRSGATIPIEVSEAHFPIDEETGGRVLVLRDVTERRDREGAMLRLAYRDRLTGLANRASATDRLQLELAHARRRGNLVGLLFLDLDGLKAVNDRHGHKAGDALLVGFADRLTASLREGDTVARLGGDEFVVLLPGLEAPEHAEGVARKILATLREPIPWEGLALDASPSIGVAVFPLDASGPQELLDAADAAMYRAKGAGGRRFARA